MQSIDLDSQRQICEAICRDLCKCCESVDNEFIRNVHLELADETDLEYQAAFAFSARPYLDPTNVAFWKKGYLRVFISHRDRHKAYAKELGNALEGYGVSSFVAHDTIEPMTFWQHEIMKGLETMEVMLAFLTDDFHESEWTNQEIGYALGKGVPVISLKLQGTDPSGFIASEQAIRGSLECPAEAVPKIYSLLAEKVGQKQRLQETLVRAFVNSVSFEETKLRFDRLDTVIQTLTEEEYDQIRDAFQTNDQLHNATHLTSKYPRLRKFLNRSTGKEIRIDGKSIVEIKEDNKSRY